MTIKVGIVGMGNIGNVHGGCYVDDPLAEIAAVCDIIQERADRAAEKYGCPAFYSVKDMLKNGPKLDACSITSAGVENGGDHYVPTMEVLAAGIPTLGEKPISNNIEHAREMVALAKKKRVPYAVDLNHRFTPAARLAKQWIADERLGQLHIMNMTMWINNPNESSPWFHLRALHPHSIDVMRYFCGPVKSVQAFLMKGKGRAIWSNAQINMLFKNNVVGHLTGSYDAGGSFGLERAEVVGSDGRFVLDDACVDLTFYDRHSPMTETFHNYGGMTGFGMTFASRIHRWLEQLSEGVKPAAVDGSGADALAVQEVIEAAITSWETHSVVDL